MKDVIKKLDSLKDKLLHLKEVLENQEDCKCIEKIVEALDILDYGLPVCDSMHSPNECVKCAHRAGNDWAVKNIKDALTTKK